MLVALTIPAIQGAREFARRVTCANHIRQLALGFLQHHQSFEWFPTGGWGWYWIGDPDRGVGNEQPGGWGFNVLPFLEQQDMYDLPSDGDADNVSAAQMASTAQAVQIPLEVMYCPSRRSADIYPRVLPARRAANRFAFNSDPAGREARNDYAANGGSHIVSWGGGPPPEKAYKRQGFTDMILATGISYQRSLVRTAHVSDGTSNTFMLGEKHVAVAHYQDGVDVGDDQNYLTGDDWDMHRWTHEPPRRDARDTISQYVFGSAHREGLNMAMVDGSIHFVLFGVDVQTFKRLGNRMDGEVAMLNQ